MKTKKIYELCFKTSDNEWHNLLFSSLKRANEDLEGDYQIGGFSHGKKIINNYVIERCVF